MTAKIEMLRPALHFALGFILIPALVAVITFCLTIVLFVAITMGISHIYQLGGGLPHLWMRVPFFASLIASMLLSGYIFSRRNSCTRSWPSVIASWPFVAGIVVAQFFRGTYQEASISGVLEAWVFFWVISAFCCWLGGVGYQVKRRGQLR